MAPPGASSKPTFASPSVDYLEALEDCKKFHQRHPAFAGELVLVHSKVIKKLIERFDVKSILDYGAGKGVQYTQSWKGRTLEQFWGVEVTKYDPAWPPYAADPTGRFDMVICTHTLGSIPPADMDWVVERLYGFASKVLFVGEILGTVKKQVFRDPSKVSMGKTAKHWANILRRPLDQHLAEVGRPADLHVLLGIRQAMTEHVGYRVINEGKAP